MYEQGTVSVGTTATLVCTVGTENDGALIQNNGSAAVFLGGPGVTTSGATQGVQLAASATVAVPSVGGSTHDLYAVVATGTADVSYLFPA